MNQINGQWENQRSLSRRAVRGKRMLSRWSRRAKPVTGRKQR